MGLIIRVTVFPNKKSREQFLVDWPAPQCLQKPSLFPSHCSASLDQINGFNNSRHLIVTKHHWEAGREAKAFLFLSASFSLMSLSLQRFLKTRPPQHTHTYKYTHVCFMSYIYALTILLNFTNIDYNLCSVMEHY